MNSMLKNTLLVAGLTAAVLTGVRAADSAPPPAAGDNNAAPQLQSCPCRRHGGARDRLQHLSEALDLTPEQQNQIAAVFQAVAPQKQAIMNEPLSQTDRRARLHALKTDTRAKVRAVLTPDQQKKFDAMPHPRRGPKGGGPGGPEKQLQRLNEALNLTQEQKDQAVAIFKESAPQRQAIMNDESLSREDRWTKLQELWKASRARIRAVLTPEQQTKFDAMPPPGPGPRGGGPDAGKHGSGGHERGPGGEPSPGENSPPPDNP